MRKHFKNKIHYQAFIISSILIFILFGAIGCEAYLRYGFIWQILVVFPFAPTIFTYINFRDRNKLL